MTPEQRELASLRLQVWAETPDNTHGRRLSALLHELSWLAGTLQDAPRLFCSVAEFKLRDRERRSTFPGSPSDFARLANLFVEIGEEMRRGLEEPPSEHATPPPETGGDEMVRQKKGRRTRGVRS